LRRKPDASFRSDDRGPIILNHGLRHYAVPCALWCSGRPVSTSRRQQEIVVWHQKSPDAAFCVLGSLLFSSLQRCRRNFVLARLHLQKRYHGAIISRRLPASAASGSRP
jgi:hypothetical protein